MASGERGGLTRPDVKWEKMAVGDNEKNAPLPAPPTASATPPSAPTGGPVELEQLDEVDEDENPYISIGELAEIDIGSDSDVDVDDIEESDDLFLNRIETMLGLDDFNRIIRIVKSGSDAIFTVPQGAHEPAARARLNTLDLWNSFDDDDEVGDVVDIDFDPFASIKKKRRNSTYSKRRNSRASIRKGSIRGPGYANREVLDHTIPEDADISSSTDDPFSGFGGVKDETATPDLRDVSPLAKPVDPFASFSVGAGPLAESSPADSTAAVATSAPGNRRAVWSESGGAKDTGPRRLTGLDDDSSARMSATKSRFASDGAAVEPATEARAGAAQSRERVASGLSGSSRRERVSSGVMKKPSISKSSPGPVTERTRSGTVRATPSPRASPGGRSRLSSTGRSGVHAHVHGHGRAPPDEPEFMSRLSAFKATWVEQGLARRPEEDVVDEVLATVDLLAAANEGGPDKGVLKRRLSMSIKRGELPESQVSVVVQHLDATMRKLVEGIQMCGLVSGKGSHVVKFGTLNDQVGSHFDNLGGLLKAAREKGLINYRGYLMIPGLSDEVYIELLQYDVPDSTPDSYTVEHVRLISSSAGAEEAAAEEAASAEAEVEEANVKSPLRNVVTAPKPASAVPPRSAPTTVPVPKPASAAVPKAAPAPTTASAPKPAPQAEPTPPAAPKAAFNPFAKKKDSGTAASNDAGNDGAEPAPKKYNPFGGKKRNTASRLQVLSMKRVKAAGDWADKEIHKLIAAIKECGTQEGDVWSVPFGILFSHTENTMEALAGTLKSSKQRGVVAFDAEVLMQRYHDEVVISLLKETFTSTADAQARRPARAVVTPSSDRKTSGFDHGWTHASKCALCSKTIYQAEYIGASGKPYHKQCFACATCKKLLTQTSYSVSRDGGPRCGKCHREFELTPP